MTCAYTAVAIMQLVEEERLSIDDTLGQHLPEVPAAWRPITLRQLMAHTSGLPDYTKQPGFDPARDYSPAEVLALVRDVPLSYRRRAGRRRQRDRFFSRWGSLWRTPVECRTPNSSARISSTGCN